MGTEDLQELLDDSAVENVRLEFKQEEPNKEQTIKKLSSFANTYGGYMVVGAEADNDGRLKALPGVDIISGYKQKIVQWCYDAVSPPINPFVSDPIPSPRDKDKVCYVVFVEESEATPHFLNSRQGAWVRTDEFSQRYEPRLANFDEIRHLADRRKLAVDRRLSLVERADRRLVQYLTTYLTDPAMTGEIGASLKLAVTPQFPTTPLVEHLKLIDLAKRIRFPWRSSSFPLPSTVISQHESVITLLPCGVFSLMELSTWGQAYYAVEVEEIQDGQKVIPFHRLLGFLLTFLTHAQKFVAAIGYDGTLKIRLHLERILQRPFSIPLPNSSELKSILDDELMFEMDVPSNRLQTARDDVAGELLRVLFTAVNWPVGVSSPTAVKELINMAYEYNSWGATRMP